MFTLWPRGFHGFDRAPSILSNPSNRAGGAGGLRVESGVEAAGGGEAAGRCGAETAGAEAAGREAAGKDAAGKEAAEGCCAEAAG